MGYALIFRRRVVRCAAACLVLVSGLSVAMADEPIFPTLTATDLNGREVTLPRDLPDDPALVLIPFRQEQQRDINKWIAALNLSEREDIAWIEMPTVGAQFRLISGWVDSGMRSGIVTFEGRARTITVYGQRRVMDALRLPTRDQVYAVVSGQDGQIRLIERGVPDAESEARVEAALGIVSPGVDVGETQ